MIRGGVGHRHGKSDWLTGLHSLFDRFTAVVFQCTVHRIYFQIMHWVHTQVYTAVVHATTGSQFNRMSKKRIASKTQV